MSANTSSPMRIGVVPVLRGSGGGLYQHSLNILHALDQWKGEGCVDRFVLLVNELDHPLVASLKERGWGVKPLRPPMTKQQMFLHIVRRIVGEGPHREAWRWLRRKLRQRKKQDLPHPEAVQFKPQVGQWLRRCGVDLMFYTAPSTLAFEAGIPYVVFIMDLQHRLQPHFPEVSADGEWERREYLFRNAIRYATLLIVDSEAGKEDVLSFYGAYGATADRIKVLPYLPACYLSSNASESETLRVREKYKLPERYLFYPAQFWPHKNHAVIIQALERLKHSNGIEIPVVFCGSYTGRIREQYFRVVMNMARYCGVAEQVHYLGYVPDEDMAALYSGAAALVMPTFFGPANIPYLEAWAHDCPVLTSNIRGIREQVGEAGLLVDPGSVEEVAEGIYRLWTDDRLRQGLIEHGRQKLKKYSPEEYRRRLVDIIEEAKERVQAGDCPIYSLTREAKAKGR